VNVSRLGEFQQTACDCLAIRAQKDYIVRQFSCLGRPEERLAFRLSRRASLDGNLLRFFDFFSFVLTLGHKDSFLYVFSMRLIEVKSKLFYCESVSVLTRRDTLLPYFFRVHSLFLVSPRLKISVRLKSVCNRFHSLLKK